MKSLLKALVVACGLLASASFAHASSLLGANVVPQTPAPVPYVSPGSLRVGDAPNASVQVTNTGLVFSSNPANGMANGDTSRSSGTLAGFNNNAAIFSNFTFANTMPQQLFTALNAAGTQTLTFVVTSYQFIGGKYYFYGNLTTTQVTGCTSASTNPASCMPVAGTSTTTGGSLAFTPLDLNGGVDGFTGTLAVTPEPSSLILLGTGLIAAAGMVTRRRRGRNVAA